MTVRPFAYALALSRIGFGIAYIAAPQRAGRGWVGDAAEDEATGVLTRALGARDLALGTGALRALMGRDRHARDWLAAHALSDATDLGATLAARRRIPSQSLRFALPMTAGSTAAALAAVVGLRDS
jgi:hypothetical protein